MKYSEKTSRSLIAGFHMEDKLFESLWNNGLLRATQYEDKFLGIDGRLNGLPVDLTCHITGKDHMEKLSGSIWLDKSYGFCVNYGIRVGNSHDGFTPFEEPVLVIGLSCPRIDLLDEAIRLFKKNFGRIGAMGEDLYWNWMDSHPECEL